MMFHVRYEYEPDQRDRVHARFKETGAPPPAGVEMHGRWHSAEGNRGFLLAEAPEAEALARWLQQWSDALTFEATPVLTDEQFTRVIA